MKRNTPFIILRLCNLLSFFPPWPPPHPTPSQINTPSPITQIHRLSFLVRFFFSSSSSHFLVTTPATCFKSSFWQTTNKLKYRHSYNTMWRFRGRLERKQKRNIHTIQKQKQKETKSEKHLHLFYPHVFFRTFLEKRYTVASYQSRITCRYNTT